jgi:hypothetical protein
MVFRELILLITGKISSLMLGLDIEVGQGTGQFHMLNYISFVRLNHARTVPIVGRLNFTQITFLILIIEYDIDINVTLNEPDISLDFLNLTTNLPT